MVTFSWLQTYDEFMALAERGDMRAVHEHVEDLSKGIDLDEDTWYSEITKKTRHGDPVFLYGKTVGKTIGASLFLSNSLCISLKSGSCRRLQARRSRTKPSVYKSGGHHSDGALHGSHVPARATCLHRRWLLLAPSQPATRGAPLVERRSQREGLVRSSE